tara:strand:+ start:3326 stop:3892 length:567 start_codon:yes stop_codon:yes gene_type:complete
MRKQVRNGLMIAAIVASFGLYSCGESKEKDTTIQQDEMEMSTETAEVTDVEEVINVQFKETTIQTSFEHYLGIKTSLVESNTKEAQEHAQLLLESLKEIKAEQVLLDATQQLADATDINKQREAFSKITKGMEVVLTGAVSSGEIYKQYCPMAFEGKGDYWYSSSKEIRNPYFGDKMLKCGRVDEVIN